MNDARDPYLGLNNLLRRQAQEMIPNMCAVGTVLSVSPLRVRGAGLDLDKDDLMVAQHLLGEWAEQLKGKCKVKIGTTDYTGTAWMEKNQPLKAGDRVLLIPDEDGQTYFLTDKLVEVEQ